MPTFIKTGFWEKVKRAPKEWLNLDKFVEDKINSNPPDLGYKEYVGIINQSGTSDPTITIIKNDLGFDITWKRENIGVYNGYTNLIINQDKILCQLNYGWDGLPLTPFGIGTDISNNKTIIIINTSEDQSLTNASIIIRIYS